MYSIPITARKISNILPEKQRDKLKKSLEKHNFLSNRFRKAQIPPEYIIEYYFIYAMAFLCFFFSTFVWIKICAEVTGDKIAAFLGTLLFNLLMPLFETGGGYFYDFVELLFFSLAVYFAYHGRLLLLILIISFAELNKESFLFFIFTLYPLIRRTQTIKTSIFTVGLAVLIAGLIYLITRSTYLQMKVLMWFSNSTIPLSLLFLY